MNKLLLLAATALSCSSLIYAEELKKSPIDSVKSFQESILPIKLIGVFEFEANSFSQSDRQTQNKSGFNEQFALKSSGAIAAIFEKNLTETLKYGAKITFKTTTLPKASPKFNGSHIYLEDVKLGKVTLGADYGAMASSSVSGLDAGVAKRGASVFGISNKITNKDGVEEEIEFSPYYDFILDDELRPSALDEGNTVEPSRKIVYYSPKLLNNGLQFIVSFTPDSSNSGMLKTSTKKIGYTELTDNTDRSTKIKYRIPLVATNVISAAAVFENQITPDWAIQIGASFETGSAVQTYEKTDDSTIKPKTSIKWTKQTTDSKVNDLFSWNLGAKVTYQNFAVALSYANLGNAFGVSKNSPIYALLSEEDKGLQDKDTTYLAASLGYSIGEYAVSISGFKSTTQKTPFKFVAVGGEYKAAPNLKFFAEISHAWFNNGQDNAQEHTGSALSIGTALSF